MMKREHAIWLALLIIGGGFLAWRVSTGDVGRSYIQEVDGRWLEAEPVEGAAGTAQASASRTIGIWVAALFTLFIFSFLFRDNPFYKFAEAVVVGVSAAYWMVVGFWDVMVPNLLAPLFPELIQGWALPGNAPVYQPYWWLNIVPLVMGLMLLMRLSPQGSWISRWPLAFIIGSTAGFRLVSFIQADFLSQIRASIMPLVVPDSVGDTIVNLLITLSVLACLVYFFFSIEHTGIVGRISRVGIWVLMITFGAAFAMTVMGRIALLQIRLQFLFSDWLGL